MDNNFQKLNQEEIFDEELQGMGIPFEDETVPKEIPVLERPEQEARKNDNTANYSRCCEGAGKAVDTSCAPVGKSAISLQNRSLGCVKWLGICGGIAMLLWWFQINDLMALQAAYPCIVACGVLGGFGVGMHAMRGGHYE